MLEGWEGSEENEKVAHRTRGLNDNVPEGGRREGYARLT